MAKVMIVAAVLALAAPARAGEVDDLVARGEAFAKEGEWTQAIDAFKAADAKRPRALHSCLIGLAYTRRELWPQAEVFLARCRELARSDDPAPEWVADAEKTLANKLATSSAVPVTIMVRPSTAAASVSLSTFAPDERFTPRTLHLARGTYSVEISAGGFRTETRTFGVSDRPVTIDVELRAPTDPAPSRAPRYIMFAGFGIGVAAGLYHGLVAFPAKRALDDATTNATYERDVSKLEFRRRVTYVMYGAGAATLLTALILRLTVFRGHEEPSVRVGATVGEQHGLVTIEWSR